MVSVCMCSIGISAEQSGDSIKETIFFDIRIVFFFSRGLFLCDKLNPRSVCKNIVIYRCEVGKSKYIDGMYIVNVNEM